MALRDIFFYSYGTIYPICAEIHVKHQASKQTIATVDRLAELLLLLTAK